MHFEQRPLETHGGWGEEEILWRQTWWTVSLLNTLSLGVLNTHPGASFNTGVVHTSQAPGTCWGLEVGTWRGSKQTRIPVLTELLFQWAVVDNKET